MDRKSIIVLVACFALLMTWGKLINKIYPPVTVTNQVSQATGTLPAGTNVILSSAGSSNQTAIIAASGSAPKFVVQTNVPEELLVVSNDNARYTFTSQGGGLKDVQLRHYPETVSSHRNKNRFTNELATLNAGPVPPVFAMIGDVALQGDGVFTLVRTTNGVRAEKSLANGLKLIKDFQFGTNYLITATVRWENTSKQAIILPAADWVVGTATPMGPLDNGQAEMVMWWDGAKTASVTLNYFNTNTTSWMFFSRTPLTEYKGGSSNVLWASSQNQFFNIAAMLGPKTPAEYMTVHMVNLPGPSAEEIATVPGLNLAPMGLQTTLHFGGVTVPPEHAAEYQFSLFAGPKEYQTLSHLSARFNNDIDLVMNFGFFGAISKAMLVSMNWMYRNIVPSYGWIIIIFTIIIKLVFWPLTRASTRSMKRMQALQPQLKALQEKYKDDPQKFSAKQWEFYKKNKVNPLGGCLPMLLQMPVFFGLLTMLRNAIELRGAPFLWINDLSQPDTIFILHFFPGHGFPLNLMPLIMGATQFWLAGLTPPSPSMDPAQQKMMRYMPLIMVWFLYSYSSGLALYWTVNNLLSVLQTKLTKTDPTTTTTTTPAVVTVAPQRKK